MPSTSGIHLSEVPPLVTSLDGDGCTLCPWHGMRLGILNVYDAFST